MAKKYQTIGILGGMGAEATADLYLHIIKLFQTKLNAQSDADFPEFIIDSIPCHIVEAGSNENQIRRMLVRGCKVLEVAGADFIVIPCNSAHAHEEEMRKAVSIPLISILNETVKTIKAKRLRKVFILGVGYTLDKKLFDTPLFKVGVESVLPTKQEEKILDQICLNVVSGRNDAKNKTILLELINSYKGKVQGIILGCTELPLVVTQKDTNIPLYDTIEILARAAFNYSAVKQLT